MGAKAKKIGALAIVAALAMTAAASFARARLAAARDWTPELLLTKPRVAVGEETIARLVKRFRDGSMASAADLSCEWRAAPEFALRPASGGCDGFAQQVSSSDLAGSEDGTRTIELFVTAESAGGARLAAQARLVLVDPLFPAIEAAREEVALGGTLAVSVAAPAKAGASCYWTPSANFRNPNLCTTTFIAPMSPLGPSGKAPFVVHADVLVEGAPEAYDVAKVLHIVRQPG